MATLSSFTENNMTIPITEQQNKENIKKASKQPEERTHDINEDGN